MNLGRRAFSGVIMLIISALVLMRSCHDPFEYYDPPGDSPDPIYTQITKHPEFSIFARGLELVPELVRIIDASGLYTAFIPTDSAFEVYFNEQGIGSIEDIPEEELSLLMNYHLLYDLRFLYDFWYEQAFNPKNTYKPEDTRYLTRCSPLPYTATDYLGRELLVRTENKYINVYTEELLSRAPSGGGNFLKDYKKVYGKDPDPLNINSSSLISDSLLVDLNAENGALHAINEVIEPLERIDEIISGNEQTVLFKQMMDRLTYLAPSGEVDAQGDSLYDISFGSAQTLLVPLASEEPMHTVSIPPDEVLAPLLGTIEEGYGGALDSIPASTLSLLLLNHTANGNLWDQDLSLGINTLASPDRTLDVMGKISSQEVASNGMVYYLDEELVPDLILNPVNGRIEMTESNPAAVLLWSIEASALLAGSSEWKNETVLLKRVGIASMHPAGSVVDAENQLHHLFLYIGGEYPDRNCIYKLSRSLDTDLLSTWVNATRQEMGL